MEGWLSKKGHIFATWKRRFFILEDRTLAYYETDDLKKKKGEYVIDGDSHVEVNSTNPMLFTLFAIGTGGQELELQANDPGEVQEWKDAFEAAKEVHVSDTHCAKSSTSSGGQKVSVRAHVSGGNKVISGVHKLTDIGLAVNLKVPREMQITYEVVGMKKGIVLQYDEHISPASDEKPRTVEAHVQAFETIVPPAVVSYPHTDGEYFSLLLVDPDRSKGQDVRSREYVQWAVVNIPGDRVSQGTTVCPYEPPAPVFDSGVHRYVFVLYQQGKHLVCPETAKKHFNLRSSMSSILFASQMHLYSATSGKLEDVRVSGEFSNYSILKEVSDRMTIAAISIFYSKWDESCDLVHCIMERKGIFDTVQFPSPSQKLVQQLPSHDGPSMMLIGSLVAESGSTGLEWTYDQDKLARKVSESDGSLSSLVFHDPPECPYFSYAVGHQGFYHEQVESFRRCLVQSGVVSEEKQATAYDVFYKDYLMKTRNTASDITEKYIDSLTKTFLTNLHDGKPWNECGINQSESQSITKVPTLVARYAGDLPLLLAEVRKMVRIWQVDEGCIISTKFCTLMARFLDFILRKRCSPADVLDYFFEAAREQSVGGGKAGDDFLTKEEIKLLQCVEVADHLLLHKIQDIESVLALNTAASDRQKMRIQNCLTRALLVNGTGDDLHFRNVISNVKLEPADKDMWMKCKALAKESSWTPSPKVPLDHATAAKLFGLSCDVHGVFFISCYIMRHCKSYQEAVQLNMSLGGDASARSVLVGAVFAAPIYPMPISDKILEFCTTEDLARPFYGDDDDITALRKRGSWIPIDWLCKCEEPSLKSLICDAEVLEVSRSEVLFIGGGSSRFAHIMNAALSDGQPPVRVVNASFSELEKLSDLVHANTKSILLATEFTSEEPTQEVLDALKILDICLEEKNKTTCTPHLVFMSSTYISFPDTHYGRHFSCIEKYLESSNLSYTIVRTPWMLENVFDQTKQIRGNNRLSMFLSKTTPFSTVSMMDVSKAVCRILVEPAIASDENCICMTLFPPLCMNDVALALSDVVGQRMEYCQVSTTNDYMCAMTTKKSTSEFEVEALKEICEIIEKSENGSTLLVPESDSNLLNILQYTGHLNMLLGVNTTSVTLTGVGEAMESLPLVKSEQKRASTVARTKLPIGADIYSGRWCLKKFRNEKKYQRRFIRLCREEPSFCWSKKEDQAVPKSISLSLCDVDVTKFEDLEFEFVADENGPGISVEWTVSCPKTVKGLKNSGGVNIKMCSTDPEIARIVDDEDDFKLYVQEWITQIGNVIEQGMSH